MNKIIASTERMRDLIHDLLNYSNLSGQPQFSTVDLNEILENTIADLELAIREKNAVLHTEKLPAVEAVPGQMRQLFQNLLSNALKFSKNGLAPDITVRCAYLPDNDLDARPVPEGPFVRIEVIDNGIGFDELYRDKIFTIFQRLHARSEYEGTGIGLAIVKKIVEKHSGLIGASSQLGEGATFTIVLPLKQTGRFPSPNF